MTSVDSLQPQRIYIHTQSPQHSFGTSRHFWWSTCGKSKSYKGSMESMELTWLQTLCGTLVHFWCGTSLQEVTGTCQQLSCGTWRYTMSG
jgi:hypothetical protein